MRQGKGEAAAVDHAIEHSYVRDAVVPERKLMIESLKRGLGTVTVEDVAREVAMRPLIRSEVEGRAMATTQEMLKLESRLIEFARKGRGVAGRSAILDGQSPVRNTQRGKGRQCGTSSAHATA